MFGVSLLGTNVWLLWVQLTTLPGNGVRVRTAQGFAFGIELPGSSSFYREYRLANEDAWLAKLQEIRQVANVHVEDMCRFDSSSAPVDNPNCFEHFQMGDGTLDGSVSCADMNGGEIVSTTLVLVKGLMDIDLVQMGVFRTWFHLRLYLNSTSKRCQIHDSDLIPCLSKLKGDKCQIYTHCNTGWLSPH